VIVKNCCSDMAFNYWRSERALIEREKIESSMPASNVAKKNRKIELRRI
jgi:hypothetical protein